MRYGAHGNMVCSGPTGRPFLILRFLAVTLGDSTRGLAWLGYCWQDLIYLGMPEIPKAALDMIKWDEITLPLKKTHGS